jgi:hypothetical protein
VNPGYQRIRRAAIAIAAAASLAIGGAAWAASAASAAPAVTPACTAGNLSVWVDVSQGDGAAGTIFYPLEITNISGHACTTFGYPGVSLLRANGKQLGDAAIRNPRFKPAVVTIPAGGTAHADLSYVDAEVFTSGCKPAAAILIRVFAPNQKNSRAGFFSLQGCTLTKHPYLAITVVRPGPRSDA